MFKSILKLLVVLIVLANFSVADAESKVVKVGWYDSPFNYTDTFNRRAGYAYEYQQKIAAYTGWTYEYVHGTWPDLLQMLMNGQIDLMSDVSYTPERANSMLFPSLPMGAETYYLFVSATNNAISGSDFKTLNGKRVGVNAASYQGQLFLQWAAANGVNAQLIGLNNTEGDSIKKLINGELDAFITMDLYEDAEGHATVPIVRIGQSNFYFAVNKNRPDLLNDLNFAMNKINDENRFYNEYMHDKYLRTSGTNAFISNDELNWLKQHGTIRVGYLNDFAPFCDGSVTGGLTGVLKNYLELAANCTKNATLTFDTKSYSTLQDAFQALVDNEIDCVFPVHLSAYDAEKMGIMATNPFVQTEMYLMRNKSSQKAITADSQIVVAINGTNANYRTFLMDNYPNWRILDFGSLSAAVSAVDSSQADCALINNYQVPQISSDNYDLYALSTGKTMNFSFAIRRSDPALYFILNKTSSLVPTASLQSALTEYSSSGINVSFGEFLRQHMYIVIFGGLAVAVGAVLFVLRRAEEKEKLLEDKLKIQAKQMENENKASEIDNMFSTIAADYRSVYYVDLNNDSGMCYRAKNEKDRNASDLEGVKKGDQFPFREKFVQYANNYVAESYRAGFLNFIEPDNIREKLQNEVMTGHRYLVIKDGVKKYEMIRIVDAYLGKARHRINSISIGFAEVDSETVALIEENCTLNEELEKLKTA